MTKGGKRAAWGGESGLSVIRVGPMSEPGHRNMGERRKSAYRSRLRPFVMSMKELIKLVPAKPVFQTPPLNSLFLLILYSTPTMPTELPYAADAQVSLSYDELEVIHSILALSFYPQYYSRYYAYSTRRNLPRHTSLSRPSLIMLGAL